MEVRLERSVKHTCEGADGNAREQLRTETSRETK